MEEPHPTNQHRELRKWTLEISSGPQWQFPRAVTITRLIHIACVQGEMLSFRSCNGGSGLIGKRGRKTANVCDKHAKETTRNIATDFTRLLSSFFSGNRSTKFLNMFRKTASGPWASIQRDANFRKEKAKESRSFPLSKRMNRPACKTDIWILPQGTLTLVRPLTQRASEWISQHVQG